MTQPQLSNVTLTSVESSHLATLLYIAGEAVRVLGLEALSEGRMDVAFSGAQVVHKINDALLTIGARQNGEARDFDIPEGEIVSASEFLERSGALDDDEPGEDSFFVPQVGNA